MPVKKMICASLKICCCQPQKCHLFATCVKILVESLRSAPCCNFLVLEKDLARNEHGTNCFETCLTVCTVWSQMMFFVLVDFRCLCCEVMSISFVLRIPSKKCSITSSHCKFCWLHKSQTSKLASCTKWVLRGPVSSRRK